MGEKDWWNALVPEPPETSIIRPQYQDEGPFERGRLMLTAQSGRIDWIYGPDIRRLEEGLPIVGPVDEVLEGFSNLMHRWLEMSPPLMRLAFGAILLQPAEDRRHGYGALSSYLPAVKLDADTSSDFVYQINRPRSSVSGIPNLRVNRLSKWSVMQMQKLRLEVQVAEAQVGQSAVPYEQHSACRLELDINTAPEFGGELPKGQLPMLFDELVSLGKEIALQGDIQ